jgi:SAM-dependent methyltransferase
MPEITIHPSIANIALDEVLAASLRANRLDSKLLYVTPRQADLWREVSLKHSPIHTNPEFTRIYRDAYEHVVRELRPGKVELVGLGPGTGFKEAELAARLQSHGHEVRFTAIDVSRDLVEEAANRVCATGAEGDRHLVCDLAEIEFIKGWLDASEVESPRLFTLFGVVPNLEPSFVAELLCGLLRPGDWLLTSVHLAPVGEGMNLEAAMKKILPQYDNRAGRRVDRVETGRLDGASGSDRRYGRKNPMHSRAGILADNPDGPLPTFHHAALHACALWGITADGRHPRRDGCHDFVSRRGHLGRPSEISSACKRT